MEQLDSLIDKLVKQFVAQVRPVLEVELAKIKEKDDKISVLEAANFELRQTIEGFEKEHKIKVEKPKVELKEENLNESIEISDDEVDDDATMVSQLIKADKSPILNTSSKSSKQPPVLTQNTASKLLFGDDNQDSSDDEDFNTRPAPHSSKQRTKTKKKETKRSLEVKAKLQSTLDTLNEDEQFWHETVLSKKRLSDGATKKPSTKRQKTRQTKLTPVKSTTTTKKKTAQLDLAKLQD